MLVAESQLRPFGHEPTAIAARRVLWVGAVVAALVLIIIAVLYQIVQRDMIPRVARLTQRAGAIPPAPRLQTHPHSDLVALLQQEKALLSSYAWTDSTHGAARIPIERAMAIYVQEQGKKKQATAASTSSAITQEPRQ
jgi:hypothetical protein